MPKIPQYSLASLDIFFIREELTALIGSRLSRIYGHEKQLICLFSIKNDKKVIFSIKVPENVSFVPVRTDAPENPSGTIVALRNALEGSMLSNVMQEGFDRILRLSFKGRESWTLVVELFSHGNWFLLDEQESIKIAHAEEDWKDRALHRGMVYSPPKPVPNVPALDEHDIHDRIVHSSRDSIVKALAVDLGLGGIYAEEVCLRAGVDKHEAIALFSHKDAALLKGALGSMFAMTPRGYVYPDVITPVALLSHQDVLMQEFPSFLEARALAIPHVKSRAELDLERAKAVLHTQESAVSELAMAQATYTEKAQWLYNHYAQVVDVLTNLRQGSDRNAELVANLLHAQGLNGSLDLSKAILHLQISEENS